MVRMIRWSCSQAFGWHSETLLALLGNGCFCLLYGFCSLQHMSKWSEPYGIILPYSPNLHRLLFSHGTCQGGHTRPKVDVGPAACFLCVSMVVPTQAFFSWVSTWIPNVDSMLILKMPWLKCFPWNDFKRMMLERSHLTHCLRASRFNWRNGKCELIHLYW